MNFGGIFDIEVKKARLGELEVASQNPAIWSDQKAMAELNQEKVIIEKSVAGWDNLQRRVQDSQVLLEMAEEETDEESFEEVKSEIVQMVELAEELEVASLLSGESDVCNAYLSINSGAGGTEACDWASMLMRMYVRYAEAQGFKVEIMAISEGEEAGIKSVTMSLEGPMAYGLLKAENGVHRLVRISPFDSNARRHTSFTSVSVWPEVNDEIEIEIKNEDIRVDTYRASGAGGQHINKTDSAVRITHEPTGAVVQCQSQRSQHANRDKAMKMLKAALYEIELAKQQAEKDEVNSAKLINEWGSQIRSYVLHPYQMVKDHRTNFESGNPDQVLDGKISPFVESYLKAMAGKGE